MMKTISIQAATVGVLENSPAWLAGSRSAATSRAASAAAWLPAPSAVRAVPGPKMAARGRGKSNLWMQLPQDPPLERAVFAGLACAAGIGVAYGFMCLVNLVENWAAVNLVVGRMIQ